MPQITIDSGYEPFPNGWFILVIPTLGTFPTNHGETIMVAEFHGMALARNESQQRDAPKRLMSEF